MCYRYVVIIALTDLSVLWRVKFFINNQTLYQEASLQILRVQEQYCVVIKLDVRAVY